MSVVNGFGLLVIATNDGLIQVLNFSKKEFLFTAKLIARIPIDLLIAYKQAEKEGRDEDELHDLEEQFRADSKVTTTTEATLLISEMANNAEEMGGGGASGEGEVKSTKKKVAFANKMLVDCAFSDTLH